MTHADRALLKLKHTSLELASCHYHDARKDHGHGPDGGRRYLHRMALSD